jgi:hypothetical protein
MVLRRTLMAWMGNFTMPLLVEVADLLGEVLSWSGSQKQAEIDRAAHILREKHGLPLEVAEKM